MKRCLVSMALILAVVGTLACTQAPPTPAAPAAGAPAGGAPAGPALTLKLAMYNTPNHIYTKTFKKYLPWVEQGTNGRVKIEIYDSETLGKANEFFDLVQRGVADMAFHHPPYQSATFTLFDEMALPFVYRDYQGQMDTWQNGMEQLYLEELKAKGLDKVGSFGFVTAGARYVLTKKPVKVPADLKGMKLRAASSMERDFADVAGASGVAMVASEVYEGLERGIIDGALVVHTQLFDWKLAEVAKQLVYFPLSYLGLQYIYNTDSWNRISAADRPAVEAGIRLAIEALNAANIRAEFTTMNQLAPAAGVVYNTPTPEQAKQWQALGAPLLESYRKKNGERGQKALEIIEKYNKR